jgi:hypothetical protein
VNDFLDDYLDEDCPDEDQDDSEDDDPDDDGGDDDDDQDEDGDSLHQDLKRLSDHFPLWLDDDYRFVVVRGVKLPPGYNYDTTDLLVGLPADYPCSPPGIGDSPVYTSPDLRFHGRVLADLHPGNPKYATPGHAPWAWLCYRTIDWDPLIDDLIKFVEMVRADLTDPPTV